MFLPLDQPGSFPFLASVFFQHTQTSQISTNIINMADPSTQTILVSGATGFVATHVIKTLLSKGYKVRGTVRSEKSADTLRKTFATHPSCSNLSSVLVPDIGVEKAFHDAVKGVDGIMHTACPFQFVVEGESMHRYIIFINICMMHHLVLTSL